MSIKHVTIPIIRPDSTGQNIWLNGFKYTQPATKFYSYPHLQERSEFDGLASLTGGRCVTTSTDGTTTTQNVAECDSIQLSFVCIKPQGNDIESFELFSISTSFCCSQILLPLL